MLGNDLSQFFSGEKLYGNDFTAEQIIEWFHDEAEGYSGLGAKDRTVYEYKYHALNILHGFRFFVGRNFSSALGIGSAYGDEFIPIKYFIEKVSILDPSDSFADVSKLLNIPTSYFKPNPIGDIAFHDNSFDFISCLGVLHHIPNVQHVLNECYRCLSKDGVMLLREPITSMGDWRKRRVGLTKRERGIPVKIMDKFIQDCGFKILNRAFCNFPVLPIVADNLGIAAYNNTIITKLDSILSVIFSWNVTYHRTNFFRKLAPASVYYVLSK
jgi:SAM-dependent methyltransferase